MKKTIYLFVLLSLLAGSLYPVHGAALTADVRNTYLYDYTQPPLFQPSLNGQFTSLSDSVTTVLANPAGIMKVNTIEAVFGVSGLIHNPIVSKAETLYLNDRTMEPQDAQGADVGISIRFTDDRNSSTPEARPIPLLDEYSKGGGINYFGLTFRVSDGLGFAFSRQRPTALNINMNLTIPEMVDITADMRGFKQTDDDGNGFQIRQDGYIEILQNDIVTGTSEAGMYTGFLDQSTNEVNWINIKMNNTVVNQQSIIVSTGLKTGQVDWGMNIIPITYNIDYDNNVSIYSDENNGNMKYLVPDILGDPGSFEVFWWATVEATSEAGYFAKEIATHPTNEVQLGGIVSAGKYSGSALRMDIGAKWEPNDAFSVGFMYENFNGARLIMSGTNIVHYARHYVDVNSEMPTLEGDVWYPYLDEPTHEADAEKYIQLGSTLPPIVLPIKLKFGFAFKKPIVLALDLEQWQSDVGINTDPGSTEGGTTATFHNLSFIKAGMESQLFFLPILFRGSLTMLMKPSTDDPDIQKSLDDTYASIPVIPVEGDIYFSGKISKGELGFGLGGGGLPLTMAMGADMSKIARIFFTDIYYAEEFWRVSYQMTTDPILTTLKSDLSGETLDASSLKLATTSTLSVGFKF